MIIIPFSVRSWCVAPRRYNTARPFVTYSTINAALFEQLASGNRASDAMDAINDYTRQRMRRGSLLTRPAERA